MRLSEGNTPFDHLRGSGHEEQGVPVLFELGPLMRLQRVLNREFVQVELCLNLAEEFEARLMDPNPHHVPRLLQPFG